MNASATTSIVDLDWVAAHLDDESVQLIEVDVTATPYLQGHVPGALLWNIYADLRHPDYSPVSTSAQRALISRSGIGRDATVVFHGYGAHLGYWLLKSLGHDRALLLDGAREQWLESGRSWSDTVPAPARSEYPAVQADPQMLASFDETLALVGSPEAVILDVRSQAEFDGINFWPSGAPEDAGRPGHIPGAVHLPIESFRTTDGRYRDAAEMTRALRAAGVNPEQRVVTYCTIGNRAAQAWYALTHLLDYPDAAVYAGSWAEWGFRT